MLTISVKDFDETAIAIMKISENLWHYLYRLLDQLDKPKMDLFLIRLHDLLTEKASPIIWIVEESDTEFKMDILISKKADGKEKVFVNIGGLKK